MREIDKRFEIDRYVFRLVCYKDGSWHLFIFGCEDGIIHTAKVTP